MKPNYFRIVCDASRFMRKLFDILNEIQKIYLYKMISRTSWTIHIEVECVIIIVSIYENM